MLKISFDAPKSMVDYAQTSAAKEKPYDICLHCPFISESCDGPNILAMDYPRWVEWANQRMKRMNLTKGEVALQSGIPQSTVKSALSGVTYDIRTETMREITRVLIGGCWGQYPCHLAAVLMAGNVQEAESDVDTTATIFAERVKMEDHVKQVKSEYQAKVDYLKEQVIHWKEEAAHWKEEARIRDEFLKEKNKTIDKLMDKILG